MGGPGWVNGESYDEFDNFHKCSFVVDGLEYPTSETYYQCSKAINNEDHEKIRSCSGMKAWVEGNKIKIRDDWESVKVECMYKANFEKFSQNELLKKVLLSTKGEITFYNSTDFWCKWNSKILKRLREELKDGDGDVEIIEQIKKEMDEYRELMNK
jgi:ribA/ribD-fused uncharacterized protein